MLLAAAKSRIGNLPSNESGAIMPQALAPVNIFFGPARDFFVNRSIFEALTLRTGPAIMVSSNSRREGKGMASACFSGSREKWLPLYQEFRDRTAERVGRFDEQFTLDAVQWKYATTFAEIRPLARSMEISFAADRPHDEWKPAKIARTSKNRVAHSFEVTDGADFPELIERVAEAYRLTQAGRARRPPAEKISYATVDEYIAQFSDDVRPVLEQVRRTIREAAPGAVERISWQMPTYWQGENLVHFAAFRSHVGLYPGEEGVRAFADRLRKYDFSKGSIRFPLSEPMPLELIAEIARFRAREVEGR